ncbi:NEP1-interacting protein-like 2 [Ananas comosus]|uniref:NEP1-interacting protein-like 2 n=1 Tax=Ananas comosus TaxID=4615 RepID=A0A6P5FFA6_ANACO|nr:NEP1-interacting protein-like 2 [Ananas comosus]
MLTPVVPRTPLPEAQYPVMSSEYRALEMAPSVSQSLPVLVGVWTPLSFLPRSPAIAAGEISGDHHAESEGTGAAAELQRQVRAATDCVVCLEEIRAREQCRALPPCDHVFHAACVDRWLVKSSACPICRATV